MKGLHGKTAITQDAEISACVAAATTHFGGVDCLVNCACSYADKGMDSTCAEWLAAFDINAMSPESLSRTVSGETP